MVRGFSFQDPRWQMNLGGSTIDPSWAKAPQVSFEKPVAGLAKGFMEGLNAGDAFISRREVGKQVQGLAGEGTPAEQLMGAGASYSQAGGAGSDTMRKLPTFAGGNQTMSMPSGTFWSPENRQAIAEEAKAAGINPEELATVMSYETGGTLNPWQKGPTTKWGQHRGLIQWGEPQAQKYGVTEQTPFRDQVRASIQYLKDKGFDPNSMGLLEMYSAINAGGIGPQYYGRSDAAAGGAPGTVADKVANQMGGHRARAAAWFKGYQDSPTQVAAPAPGPQAVAAQQPQGPVPAQSPVQQGTSVQDQARAVLAQPDQYDPRTVEWATSVVGNQQPAQVAAAPQLAPSPNDRETAAAVTQNQVATQQASQQPKPPTFMGLPTQMPGGNVNPGAPVQGGGGQDILMGGSGGGSPGGPPQQPAPAAAVPPAPAAGAPIPRAAPQYRAPIRQAGGNIDPRLMRAFGTAIAGGDPNTISAMQSLVGQGSRSRSPITLEQLPDGSTVLVDQSTGEVSPYSGPTGQMKAPDTIEQNGVRYQWNGQAWTPAIAGTPEGNVQWETVAPGDTLRRQALNIDPSDKRAYQYDRRTGKLDPINEQRAVDDKTYQQETGLREKYEGITKDNRASLDAYSRVQAAVADIQASGATPASDMGLVFGLMKMYDPTSVVRETEYANAQNAGSVPERISNAYNKVLEGTILTPAQRADFVRQAYNLQKENVKIHNGQAKRFQALAKGYGLRPEMVADIWAEPDEAPTRKEVQDALKRTGAPVNADGEVEVVSERAAENLKLPKGTVIRFTAGPLKGKRAVVE